MGNPTIAITDGVTRINLFSTDAGWKVDNWLPSIMEPKGGGVWRDSSLSNGRRLALYRQQNAIETFTLKAYAASQNEMIRLMQDLRRLLNQARDYQVSGWGQPVWLEAAADCETNTRYALVLDWRTTNEGNPFGEPFTQPGGGAVLDGFALILERGDWTANAPGVGVCAEVSSLYDWTMITEWAIEEDLAGGHFAYSMLRAANGYIYAGDAGQIWRSTDAGVTWAVNTTSPANNVTRMIQRANGYILAGGNAELWQSTNNGTSWANLGAYSFTDIVELPDGTLVRLTTSAPYLSYSTDGGANWVNIGSIGLPYGASLLVYNGYLYVGNLGSIAYAPLAANAYRNIANYLNFVGLTYIVQSMAVIGSYFYAGLQSGQIWRCPVSALPAGILSGQLRMVSSAGGGVGFLGHSTGRIYSLSGNTVYFSDDEGNSWHMDINLGAAVYALVECLNTDVLLGETRYIYRKAAPATSTVELGQAATCTASMRIANKHTDANLTHVFIDDGGVFGANQFPGAAYPLSLLPAVPVVGDAVYFGIDTAVSNDGPFESLVLNISTILGYVTSYTVTWEYYTGAAWAALTVHDGTYGAGGSFGLTGVNSLSWAPPADWAVTAVNGVSAWWVRARVSAAVGALTAPAINSIPYSVVLPYGEIDTTEIGGDYPALARLLVRNVSDQDGRAGSGPDLYANRVIMGLRSASRGEHFRAFLNLATAQQPTGITAAAGTGAAFGASNQSITGELLTWTSVAGDTTFADRGTISLDPAVVRDFYGTYQVFARAQVTAGSAGDITLRLQARAGSGGITVTSEEAGLQTTTAYELVSLGKITLPPGAVLASEIGDITVLAIQGKNGSGAGRTVYLHDIILIPVDECAVDAVDQANITGSVLGRISTVERQIDMDSIVDIRSGSRAVLRAVDANDSVVSIWQPITSGEIILQSGETQRLYFLTARTSATGAAYSWIAEPWMVHSLQVYHQDRYYSGRGDR